MTDKEKMTEIMGKLMLINDPQCLKTIANTARSRKDSLLEAATLSWQVGDKVQMLSEYQSRKPHDAIGTIVKINKVKMKIDFNGLRWHIPKTMLMKVK